MVAFYNRRCFLKAAGKCICAATMVTGSAGLILERIRSWETLYPIDYDGNVEAQAWKILFNSTDPPGLYAGNGNPLGEIDTGKLKLSSYLKYSSSKFSSYIARALKINPVIINNYNNDIYDYHDSEDALFLGGPVSNDTVKKILGYKDVTVKRDGKYVSMPMPMMDRKEIRWGMLHGEQGFGIYDGKKEFARRYDGGKEVNRAIYKLIDKNNKQIISPTLDRNGFLENEWLSIVKLKKSDSIKIFIGGMHGYSTETFSREITKNIEQLARLTHKFGQYQIIVPVNLNHTKDSRGELLTNGELNWNGSKVQEISV